MYYIIIYIVYVYYILCIIYVIYIHYIYIYIYNFRVLFHIFESFESGNNFGAPKYQVQICVYSKEIC